MSISERISPPSKGRSAWHVPRSKQKQIVLAGELSILFGTLFLCFGVFNSKPAGAEIEPSALAVSNSESQLSAFTLAPPVPQFREDALLIKPQDDFNHVHKQGRNFEAIAIQQGKPPVELQAKLAADAEAAFVGGRVRAGYLLPTTKIEWFDAPFIISHYTFALESDPMYANDKKVSVPGLPETIKLREGFVFGGRGIIQQGTGVTEDGDYISIDWTKSHYDEEDVSNNRWEFRYGIGRPVEAWKTVAVRHPALPPGTRIIIENYSYTQEFIVGDAGLDLAENQIDIFVGPMTIEEADKLGVQRSRIGIVRPISTFSPDNQAADKAPKE